MTFYRIGPAWIFFLLVMSGLRAAAPADAVWRLMPIGDSITEGGSTFVNYRPLLAEKLRAAGFVFAFVGTRGAPPLLHEGYGGKTIEFLANTVPAHFAETPADIILLHAGHNHFYEEKPIPSIVAATERLIGAVRAINPRVITLVAQVIPSGKLPKYAYIPELNRALAKLVSRLHSNVQPVILVDQATHFDWKTDTITDRVHPNAAGAAKMAEAWSIGLQPFLRQTQPAVR
jgi:lysophospholipase L1-like esterase